MKSNCLKVFMAMTAVVLLTSVLALASEMDKRIESSAKQSYVFKTYLKDDAVKIQAKDGMVKLTGTVNEESHKSLAKETVANLPGVKSVDNQLVLKGEPPTENSDGWISMQVKYSLLYHRYVSGKATSGAGKDLATKVASDVNGVMQVINNMTIADPKSKI